MVEKADKKKKSFVLDDQKVLTHLEKVNFALPDMKNRKEKIFVKIPKRFSISENPDKTIYFLRKLYTIGMCNSVQDIVFDV